MNLAEMLEQIAVRTGRSVRMHLPPDISSGRRWDLVCDGQVWVVSLSPQRGCIPLSEVLQEVSKGAVNPPLYPSDAERWECCDSSVSISGYPGDWEVRHGFGPHWWEIRGPALQPLLTKFLAQSHPQSEDSP